MGSIIYLLFLPLVGIYYLVVSLIVYVIPERLKRKKNIKGQIILITGAGSGLGRQLAVEFSKHATCLILVDINKQSLLQTQKMVDGCSTVFVYECDVSDYKKVYEMAEKVKKDAGDVDILVNNAGLVSGKYLVDLPEDKIVKTMEVNTLAHFWVFLLVVAAPSCLGNAKLKKTPVPLSGLYGMRYIPLVPYNFLGLNPVLLQGSGLRPKPAVVKEKSPEDPAPYVPQYGDMEKLVGYGGLPMPYGGYGYPFLYGYSGDVK